MKDRHRQEEAEDDKILANHFLIDTKSNSRDLMSQDGATAGRFYLNHQADKSQSTSGMEGLKGLVGHGTVSPANYANGHRDVFYLMEKFKEESKGQGTTDICVLFSFWQSNFATMNGQQLKNLLASSNAEDR